VTAEPAEGAPASYASRDEARAYVARVLARSAPATPGEVYVIIRPGKAARRALANLGPTLAAMLPGAALVTHADVFGRGAAVDVADRIAVIAGRVRGAVVIARRSASGVWLIGGSARAEAEGLAARGVPVLVLAPRGLVAWPDVRARPAPEPHPLHSPIVLDMPAPARWRQLPTVAASLRAIGIRPPRRSPRAASSPRPPRAARP
jgi:hypothetical protein